MNKQYTLLLVAAIAAMNLSCCSRSPPKTPESVYAGAELTVPPEQTPFTCDGSGDEKNPVVPNDTATILTTSETKSPATNPHAFSHFRHNQPYLDWLNYYAGQYIIQYSYDAMNDLSYFDYNEDIRILELDRGKFLDIHPLTTMKSLESLAILNNPQIADFSALGKMTNLKTLLILSCDRIENYDFLSFLVNLRFLRIGGNSYIHDFNVAYISQLIHLEELDLSVRELKINREDRKIVNLSLLSNLIHLKKLAILDQNIQDITWIRALQDLEYLALEFCTIEDVPPLLDLPKLNFVSFDHSKVKDIMPLIESKIIKDIYEPNYNYDESLDELGQYLYRVEMSNKFYERGIGLTDPHEH